MSEALHRFAGPGGVVAVALPVPYGDLIEGWGELRRRMLRDVAPGFSRDEWAYLATFLDPSSLRGHFARNFGESVEGDGAAVSALYRPRGEIAVWLPNNVSLLGPLTLVLLSLTGQPVRLKRGSSAEDLAGAFVRYAIDKLDDGPLRRLLESRVTAETFGRDDPRNAELAASAAVRIVFGSDAAARAVHALPHPLDSVGFSFTDRRSEAWLDRDSLDDDTLADLVRVFTIYGQAGCTSPRRVVLLDGSEGEVAALAGRLAEVWARVAQGRVPMNIASDTVKADQWARALGWQTRVVGENGGLLAWGSAGLGEFEGHMALSVQGATVAQAFEQLPANIQTVGHALSSPDDPDLLRRLARSKVLRFVPLATMHHFDSTWDGQAFWKGCFEVTETG